MGKKARKKNTHIRRRETPRYDPDPKQGLSREQVKRHRRDGWANDPVEPPVKSGKQIVTSNLFTYFNMIFLILALLLIAVGSYRSLTFLPVIVINTMIGIVQELKAKNVLDKMTMLHAPHSRVVREGKVYRLASEDLVLDDIVLFSAGNQICADAVVVSGEVRVNEALLTGEADEITKKKGDSLMSGSFVVSGKCRGKLTKVGEDSYISQLTLKAKTINKKEISKMMRALNRLVKTVGIIIIPIGLALFFESYYMNHLTARESVVSMVAAVIGMIPEGLYLLATVALAVGAVRLSQRHVLLHDMRSIESLARVDVLCVDKTGTITENKMSVETYIEAPEYRQEQERGGLPVLPVLLGDFAAAMSADNETIKALKERFLKKTGNKAISVTPFSSVVKYSSATFDEGSFVLGAPEIILRGCKAAQDTVPDDADKGGIFGNDAADRDASDGVTIIGVPEYDAGSSLSDLDFDKWETFPHENLVREYEKEGCRILAFARCDTEPREGEELSGRVVPLGYIVLSNPIRKNAPETFQYFAKEGVTVKVISGDNPHTVSKVAERAGIEGARQYIDARKIKDFKQAREAVEKYTVFGRVTPEQKRQLIKALQKERHTVAMTGDGVNDILALKDADCSIAMASGSDAAAQAAQVVLLESDFSCMPSVVLEGRRVVNNIQRSATLFLVKNIFSFLMSLVSVFFLISYPLEPSQLSLFSVFTIGIPAFVLALEPNHERITGRFLPKVIIHALPAGITDLLIVASMAVCGNLFGFGSAEISTMAVLLLALIGFLFLYRMNRPLNSIRRVLIIVCVVCFIVLGLLLHDLFALNWMSLRGLLLFAIFAFAGDSLFRHLYSFLEKCRTSWEKKPWKNRERGKKAKNKDGGFKEFKNLIMDYLK